MSRIAWLVALVLFIVAPAALGASPKNLTRLQLDYDAAVFDVDEDAPTPGGGAFSIFGKRAMVSLMVQEMGPAPSDVTVDAMLANLQRGDTVATGTLTLGNKGPAGWSCRTDIADMKGPGVTQVLKCFTLVDGHGFVIIALTSDEASDPASLAALKAAIASIRAVPAP